MPDLSRRSFLKATLVAPIAAPVVVQACVQAYRRWRGKRALAKLTRGMQSGLQSPSRAWFRLSTPWEDLSVDPVGNVDVAPDDGQWFVNWSGGITHRIGPKVQADKSGWVDHWRSIAREQGGERDG